MPLDRLTSLSFSVTAPVAERERGGGGGGGGEGGGGRGREGGGGRGREGEGGGREGERQLALPQCTCKNLVKIPSLYADKYHTLQHDAVLAVVPGTPVTKRAISQQLNTLFTSNLLWSSTKPSLTQNIFPDFTRSHLCTPVLMSVK